MAGFFVIWITIFEAAGAESAGRTLPERPARVEL
jgi:hypothetical protein